MKFYIHSDNPVMTVVVVWEDNKKGTVKDLMDIFCDSLFKKYPNFDRDVSVTMLDARGKDLNPQKGVLKNIKNKDDLFVEIKPVNQTVSDVCDKMEAATMSTLQSNASSLSEKEPSKQDTEEVFDGKLNAALVHMSNQRYRKAINLYKEVHASDKTDISAVKGLIRCYLGAERYQEAVHYCEEALKIEKTDTDILFLAGESYIKVGNGEDAIKHLFQLCKILKQNHSATTTDKQDIQVLLAKAYLVEDQKDMAIAILQGVLREDVEHTDALAEYAPLLFDVGAEEHKEEAISAIVTALVQRRNDKYIKQKFTDIMTTEDGLAVLKKVAVNVLADAPALMFLAITLREFSAIEQSLHLFELALKAEPSSVCILTYIHTLELVERQSDAFKSLLHFCKMFPDKGVGNLKFSDLIPYLESLNEDLTDIDRDTLFTVNECKTGLAPSGAYTEGDLYILAIFFTAVKILYTKGLLKTIAPLLQLIQPFCVDRDLHLTIIRNEAAYFKCVNEVYQAVPEAAAMSTCMQKGHKYLYFIGDSHCLPAAWHTTTYQGEEYTIYPILSTGTKIWHLRPESVFYPKTNFLSVIKNIPNQAVVTTCLGEIDCREAFLQCWEKAKYDTIEEAMEVVVKIYIHLLRDLQIKHGWTIFVHPVLPVLDLTRPIVMQFNRILATKLLAEPSLKWLNFVNELISLDGSSLRDEYKLEGTHIHPRYLKPFTDALNQY